MRHLGSVRLWAVMSAMVLAFMVDGCAGTQRGVAPAHGIANFGRVSGTLLRGAQPDEAGIANLQGLGVATIINLRQAADAWPGEPDAARRHGIAYVNVPLPGLGSPTDAQVAQVLALIESSPQPVFLHCEHGADRTGTIVACYRMQHDGWTTDRAVAEARQYGMSVLQFGMKHYLRDYRPGPAAPARPAPAP